MTSTMTAPESHQGDTGNPAFGEERERAHRHMLSAVAHDLKTPLASIIGSLEVFSVMQKKLSAEKQAELIQVALQEAHRLDSFITNVLDMGRLESGAVKPRLEKAEIGSLIANCLARLEYQLSGAKIETVAGRGSAKGMADISLLGRTIAIVLDNAIKYGGAPGKICIEYGKDGSAYIRIRDNGSGIPEDQHETIFNKYVRLPREGQKKIPGVGLGLAIAKENMRLLGGNISAENHPEGGAIITLRFPLD